MVFIIRLEGPVWICLTDGTPDLIAPPTQENMALQGVGAVGPGEPAPALCLPSSQTQTPSHQKGTSLGRELREAGAGNGGGGSLAGTSLARWLLWRGVVEMAQTTGALLNVGSLTRFPTWEAILCSSQGPVRVRGGGRLLAKLEQLLLVVGSSRGRNMWFSQ